MVNSPAPRSGEVPQAGDRPSPAGDGRAYPRQRHGDPGPPPSGGTRGERLAALDALRFLAAFAVLMFHFNNRGDYAILFPVTSYLWAGVELFFMISGFVICMSAWGKGVGRFATSRIVRLFPAYWFAIVLTTVVAYLFDDVFKPLGYRDILVNLTMLQTPFRAPAVQGVFWTLWPELKFYLLFSVMVWWGLTYRRAVAFCALWLIGTAVAVSTRSG
ncbi:MAG TPA: acyltransferase, partial [Catenuloplanes sp.]